MSTKKIKFNNPELDRAVENSLGWLEKWSKFEKQVTEDIINFESLLMQKKITIVTWVQIEDIAWLGWAPDEKTTFMGLNLKILGEPSSILPLKESKLEYQVLAFPYLSELTYQICARIKLAHTPNKVLDDFAAAFLSAEEEEDEEKRNPLQIATYT